MHRFSRPTNEGSAGEAADCDVGEAADDLLGGATEADNTLLIFSILRASCFETNTSIHQQSELSNIDLSVAVRIRLLDHGIQLLVRQVLSQTIHHLVEFALRDIAVLIDIENGKSLRHLIHILYSQR